VRSARAQQYLASLQRDEPLPLADVVALLDAASVPAHPAWLAFHDEFAGYWEDLGGELANWGLAFAARREVYVTNDRHGVPQWISCAEVHPSFDYLLGADGHYSGESFPADSFGVKVERNALMWELGHRGGRVRRAYELDGVSVLHLRDRLVEEMGAFLVPEASDNQARYYASDDRILLVSLRNNTVKLAIRTP
jgi:hypothetical protein